MIVDNLDRFGARIRSDEADAPLVVDPNAVLADPIPLQSLQSIARRRHQVQQSPSLMNLQQFALRRSLHILRQLLRKSTVKQRFCITVCKGEDHLGYIHALRSDRNAFTLGNR